jgi:hypothetical protein
MPAQDNVALQSVVLYLNYFIVLKLDLFQAVLLNIRL